MSKNSKLIISVVVVAVVALIIWLVASGTRNKTAAPAVMPEVSATTPSATPETVTKPSGSKPTMVITNVSTTSPIDQDVLALDTQLSGLRTDNVNADKVLNASAYAVPTTSSVPDIKAGANAQIDARVADLDALAARILTMSHLSDSEHGNLDGQIRASKKMLLTLKAKLAADTDLASVQADANTLVQDLRIYDLVLPVGYIQGSIDRTTDIHDMMSTLAGKLETQIVSTQGSQKGTGSLQTSQTDIQAKIAAAKNLAAQAQSIILNLQPDAGVAATAAKNKTAIALARAKMKTATTDLETARKDVATILAGIKASASVKGIPNAQ